MTSLLQKLNVEEKYKLMSFNIVQTGIVSSKDSTTRARKLTDAVPLILVD